MHAKRYAKARRRLLRLYKTGNSESARLIGCMYINGDGFPQDKEKGREYLREAAVKGDVEAGFLLGLTYRGVDDAEYARWQEWAAERGHLIAAQQIGLAYFKGCGVEKNDILAYRWLFSIQLRTPLAVETWTKPLDILEARMSPDDKETGRIMAWNHVYLELKQGWFQEEFERDNPSIKGPIRKGYYKIVNGRLIITDTPVKEEEKEQNDEDEGPDADVGTVTKGGGAGIAMCSPTPFLQRGGLRIQR
ncbi:MAG: sel1 repeat family protein [Kiritimatiellae bacterium]|nr:sel1 repeat family protein [Kiritimatiellia bacterium]